MFGGLEPRRWNTKSFFLGRAIKIGGGVTYRTYGEGTQEKVSLGKLKGAKSITGYKNSVTVFKGTQNGIELDAARGNESFCHMTMMIPVALKVFT